MRKQLHTHDTHDNLKLVLDTDDIHWREREKKKITVVLIDSREHYRPQVGTATQTLGVAGRSFTKGAFCFNAALLKYL